MNARTQARTWTTEQAAKAHADQLHASHIHKGKPLYAYDVVMTPDRTFGVAILSADRTTYLGNVLQSTAWPKYEPELDRNAMLRRAFE